MRVSEEETMLGILGKRLLEDIPRARNSKAPADRKIKTRNFGPAAAALKKYIWEVLKLKSNQRVSVYVWKNPSDGVRVAEISVITELSGGRGTLGCSWTRGDLESGAVILAAEDFILTYGQKPYRPKGWGSDIDEHEDARWKLKELIK